MRGSWLSVVLEGERDTCAEGRHLSVLDFHVQLGDLGDAGVSVNSWLVRAVADAVARGGGAAPVDHGDRRADPGGGQRFTGWAR